MEPRERLLNVIQLLLHTTRPLSFDEIAERLPAYEHEDRESAKRMFERDKETLRDRGIPVVTTTDPFETEYLYSIDRDRYYLPEISFDEEEVAALFIAAHGDPSATLAFGKLMWGTDQDVLRGVLDTPPAAIDASVDRLFEVGAAVRERRLVAFAYRPASDTEARREVDAWGLAYSRGSWYLIGRDRAADDVRHFRLTRITSELEVLGEAEPAPEDLDLHGGLRSGHWGLGEPELTATIAFSPKVAAWALPQAAGSKVEERPDGWVLAEVAASRDDAFLAWVRGFGPDAELVSPPELRKALVASLEDLRAAT